MNPAMQPKSGTPAVGASGPIYIGGLDRSGKTTLRAFLASHPNIAIPAVGSNMWTYFYGQFGDLGRPENLERCLDAMAHYKHVRFLNPNLDRIRREFLQGPPSYARLFSLFLIHFAEQEGKPRWGAQTGLIERYAEHLFAAYPGLKVIHMIRDPRDRYEASLAKWPDGKGRAGGATARWLYSIRLAARHLQSHPKDYKIVRFEDLIRNPEATVRGICEFVGETFQPEMLRMEGAPKHRNLLAQGSTDRSGEVLLSPENIGRYRENIKRLELQYMQLHAGQLMRTHGYEPDRLELTTGDWAHFWLAEWPNQFARMVAWRTVEAAQQRYPGRIGRKPGRRMIVEDPTLIDQPGSRKR